MQLNCLYQQVFLWHVIQYLPVSFASYLPFSPQSVFCTSYNHISPNSLLILIESSIKDYLKCCLSVAGLPTDNDLLCVACYGAQTISHLVYMILAYKNRIACTVKALGSCAFPITASGPRGWPALQRPLNHDTSDCSLCEPQCNTQAGMACWVST